ncbi:MAG: RDD family protein [Sulfurimonas sp.]|uniref:RDD family protein n=1 Tax=Sulfurimonas sp. TaxID=2022749 RepID=UPI00260AD2DD|nr:RDD family protein [Sulfurimonas sp.]MCW8894874.1 RDD family protein [Sulfurimonas sp.]MCW8953716.1 RDD family protein [Sulfurimonas sp.]MCW9067740.1 RDD family protein [Sulfurimonas sp.]
MSKNEVRYAGFWVRFIASLADTLFLALPVAIVIYILSDGSWFDFSQYQQNIQYAMSGNANKALSNLPKMDRTWELINIIVLLTVYMIFWKKYKGATPGKKFVHVKIVDAKTFEDINNTQALTRSFGYIVSTLAFLIGFIMIGFRKDKRGLHDLLAGTVVIYDEFQENPDT